MSEIIHPTKAVSAYHHGSPRVSDPILGQTASESQNTALFAQNIFERSAFVELSASIEFATDIFQPVIPSSKREKKMTRIGKTTNHNICWSGTK